MTDADPFPSSSRLFKNIRQATLVFIATASLVFFGFASSVHAQSDLWEMTRFDVDIQVRENGTFLVEETVTANFLTDRHGIFRYVPYKGELDDGAPYRIGIRLHSVKDDDGGRYKVKESFQGNNVVWRIGDAGKTLTGEHTYVITYEVRYAIRRFEDVDELFWNVTGEGWDVPLPKVKATVEYPGMLASEVQAVCYYGPYGSENTEDCFVIVSDAFTGFGTTQPDNPMTIAVGWPKGHIGDPTALEQLTWLLQDHIVLVIPFLVFAILFYAWRTHGKDESGMSIVPEHEAPLGLRPAQMMALKRQTPDTKDLAPTIIDLAVRGYLSIKEVPKEGLFGKKDYELKREKANDAGLALYESTLLDNLFGSKQTVLVSSLKNTFYKHLPDFRRQVMDSLMEKKLFEARPGHVRGKWMAAGVVSLIVLFLIIGTRARSHMLFIPVVILSFAQVFVFGWFMPRWTKAGAAAHRHTKGFRMFISKVEKHRTAWLEQEGIFEKVLPFAMAFGLGEKWAKAFEGMRTEPPSWYHGAMLGAWNPGAFTRDLTSMTNTFVTSASTSPSSSGGSGGGGFSGGGFGGGGGGSW